MLIGSQYIYTPSMLSETRRLANMQSPVWNSDECDGDNSQSC